MPDRTWIDAKEGGVDARVVLRAFGGQNHRHRYAIDGRCRHLGNPVCGSAMIIGTSVQRRRYLHRPFCPVSVQHKAIVPHNFVIIP